MAYLQKLFFAALAAGIIGGLFASALNISITVPMILQAEVYEHGAEHAQSTEHAAHEHPEMSAFARNTLTAVGMILAYSGFAFMMSVLAELKGSLTSWKSGLAWGAAGYLVFSFVPALGLHPELPGMPAADLLQRQIWWIACAACTAGAILLVANYRNPLASLGAATLLAVPFLIGAPTISDGETLVPAALHYQFVVGTLTANLVTWLATGACLGMLRSPGRSQMAARGV
jgi:cobalt transporter subunit CbtA